ncbi:O-antigen ligase [Mesorhizobium sp. KR9-304]|uniref:O-antigen ligase family protein n=1 Tax=Mesorhizobium sp. KR9-304 TaxID=3156614 RepID=UPI0032B3C57D
MHNKKSGNESASLLSRLLVHDDRRSEIFTYVCFACAPIAGSVVSFAVNIGAAGGVLEVLRRIIPVSRDRFMRYLAAPIYVYCAAYLVALAVNPAPRWADALPVLTFLLFPFLYSSWCLSRKETIARSVINASMIGCLGALALAVFQFHFQGMRAEGGAGNAIVFATVTCLAASVALAGAFIRQGMATVPLFGAYCAGSIAILYSGSRITWLALFLSTAAVLWIYRERRHAWSSALAVCCAALAVGAVTFAGAQVVPARVQALADDWRQMSEYHNYDSSLGRRTELWRIGLSAVRLRPIVGHGPQSTRTLINRGFEEVGLDVHFSHFHNGLLNAWVEAGIVGALSLAAIFVVAAWLGVGTLARTTAAEARLGAVMLIVVATTYFVSGLTGILVGHDIADAVLVAFLAVGAYLAAGTSMLGQQASRRDPAEEQSLLRAETRSGG